VSDILPAWAQAFHNPAMASGPFLHLPKRLTKAWAYGDGSGRGVKVGVIDSGIDASHPAVQRVERAVIVERDDDAPDGIAFVEGPHDDLYGHGTACAGIIRSLAPEVELYSVRVLGTNLKGRALNFAYGLDWCIENGVKVVNCSLSTGNDKWAEAFWDLVDQAAYKGVLVVSAMNNERKLTIPSEFAGVFSVACAPGNDPEAVWANPKGPAEWGACGIDVDVPWLGGGMLNVTGNSFAAPVVAGHLARIAGAHPGITVWQAKTVLAQLAVNAPGAPANRRSRAAAKGKAAG
jgi:subtilisin family serine protease